jgi:hypothetical protein
MKLQNKGIELRLQCDRDLAIHIEAALKGMPESRCRVAERKNIHGDASTCVLIATLAIKELPKVIAKLRELAAAIPVRRLQYGDIKATNISSRELTDILASNPTGRRKARSKV